MRKSSESSESRTVTGRNAEHGNTEHEQVPLIPLSDIVQDDHSDYGDYADAEEENHEDSAPPSIPLAPAKTVQAKFNPLADALIYVVVFLGGAIGTALRFGLSLLIPSSGNVEGIVSSFHIATFTVNMVACFMYAMLTAYLSQASWLRKRVRQFTSRGVGMGLCGGMSTMSTLAIEELDALQNGNVAGFVFYTLTTFLAGFAVAWIGTRLAFALSAKRGAKVIVEAFARMQKNQQKQQQQQATSSTSAAVLPITSHSATAQEDMPGTFSAHSAVSDTLSAPDFATDFAIDSAVQSTITDKSSDIPSVLTAMPVMPVLPSELNVANEKANASDAVSNTTIAPGISGVAGAANFGVNNADAANTVDSDIATVNIPSASVDTSVSDCNTGTASTVASLGIVFGPDLLGNAAKNDSSVVAAPGAIALPEDGAPPIIQPTVPLPAVWRRYEEPKPVTVEIPVVPDPLTGEVRIWKER